MMGYDVIFDLEKKRIGFAEANCGMSIVKIHLFRLLI